MSFEQPLGTKKNTNIIMTPTGIKGERRRVVSQSNNNQANQLKPSSQINKKHTLAISRRNMPPTVK